MAIAYILINCELGSEKDVMNKIRSLDGIKEVRGVYGAYDILTKIDTASDQRLREIITDDIRKINKIRSTLTLMGVEGQQ